MKQVAVWVQRTFSGEVWAGVGTTTVASASGSVDPDISLAPRNEALQETLNSVVVACSVRERCESERCQSAFADLALVLRHLVEDSIVLQRIRHDRHRTKVF